MVISTTEMVIEKTTPEYVLNRLMNPEDNSGGSGEGGGGGVEIEFPDDYARRGEAGAAADRIVEELSGDGIEAIQRPEGGVELPGFDNAKSLIDNGLPEPGIGLEDWESFLPRLTPGDIVQCEALELNGSVTSGPLRGLSSMAYLDLCNVFQVVRNVLGFLFDFTALIYIFRRFTKSEDEEIDQ
jgi:hypothetical protein